jgi:hypothetical protein
MDSYIPRRMDITAQLELNSNTFSDSSFSIPLIFLDSANCFCTTTASKRQSRRVENLFHAGSDAPTDPPLFGRKCLSLNSLLGNSTRVASRSDHVVRAVKHSKYRAFYRFLTMSSITTTGRTMRASAGIVVASVSVG